MWKKALMTVYEKTELFKFFVQYRGKTSLSTLLEHYTEWMLHVQSWWLFRKLKTVLPSLKPSVPFVLRSGLVYKIDCPHCEVRFVGKTSRHLLSRFREHKSRSNGTLKKHFALCTNINSTWRSFVYFTGVDDDSEMLKRFKYLIFQ